MDFETLADFDKVILAQFVMEAVGEYEPPPTVSVRVSLPVLGSFVSEAPTVEVGTEVSVEVLERLVSAVVTIRDSVRSSAEAVKLGVIVWLRESETDLLELRIARE